MSFSNFSGTKNSLNAFIYIFKTFPEYYSKSFSCNNLCLNYHYNCKYASTHNQAFDTLRFAKDSDILFHLFKLARFEFNLITYDYDTFLIALNNFNKFLKNNVKRSCFYSSDYIFVERLLKSELNTLFPLDFNILKLELHYSLLKEKKPRLKYIKNNCKLKNIEKDCKEEYRSYKKLNKDKYKKRNRKFKKHLKDIGNKKFRRQSKNLIKKQQFHKMPTKLNEIIDIWSFD